MAMNDFNIGFLAGLDGTKSKAKLNQDIDAIKKSLKELELKAKLDPNQVKVLENQLNSLKVNLNNVSIDKASLNNLVSQINNSLNGIRLQIPNLNTGNIGNQAQQAGQQIGQQIQNGINSVIQKGSFEKIFRASGNGINNVSKDAEAYFKTLSNIVSVQERLGTNNNLTSFTVSLKNAEGVAEQLNYQLRKITDDKGNIIDRYFEYSGGSINDNGVIQQMNSISAKADSLQTKLEKLKSSYSDMNASRPIKDSNNISALSQQYDKVAKSIENVRNADSASFSSMVSNTQREITLLENMVSQFRNAENVATQMKSVDISSGIAQAQERLGKLKANASSFDQMKQTIVDLDTAIANVGDKSSLDAFINKLKVAESQLGRVKAETKQLQDVNKIQLSWQTEGYQSKVESLIARTNQWVDVNGNARISTESLQTALNNLDTAYNNLNSSGGNTVANQQALIEAEKALDTEVKKVQSSITTMNSTIAKSSAVDSLRQKYQEFYDKNTATHRKWGKSLLSAINELAPGAEVSKQRVQELNQQLINTSNAARQAGKLGLSFFDGIVEQAKKFTQWVSVTSIVMRGIQIGKNMIQDVRELDDSLLELTKVSDLSASGLEKVTGQAYELGEKVARTGKEVIDAITEFKRAGFDMQQSMDMAESAMIMTNVAENITDTADAAGTLISVLKGFNMDASETMTIVDKINQVSNTSPIGFDNIAEGLERTAGTMAQSGNTIDQTIGLITAGYAQLRNVEKVSTGLVTLSARLRGVDEDGEVIDGLSAKLQEDFGKIGVAIEDADGSLHSIYEIAQDYSKVLPTLTDKQKQYYAELAAGKRQATVWNAITQQFQDAENAVNQSLNSQNSALDENQKKLDSIGGHVKSFESAMEHLSSTVVESDLLKFFVDLGTTGVKAIDGLVNALGSLGTIGLGAGLLASFKGAGRVKIAYPHLYTYACRNKTLYA